MGAELSSRNQQQLDWPRLERVVKRTLELTNEERLVLEWRIAGFKPSQISEKLHLPYTTVRSRIFTMRNKIGALSMLDLVLWAIHNKILDETPTMFWGS